MSVTGSTGAQASRGLILLGDDLSGTTEALAALLGGLGFGRVYLQWSTVHALPGRGDRPGPTERVAVDLDVRQAAPATARDRYAAAVRAARQPDRDDVLLLKVDSLLRGNIAAALAVVPAGPHRPVVLAPALPAQGRRTVRGRVHLDGSLTAAPPGALEGAAVDVAAAAGCPTALIDLDVVRAGPQALSSALERLAAEGLVAVCDAETDDDLDAVAVASLRQRQPVVVGAGGVAAAIGRALRGDLTAADRGTSRTVSRCSGSPGGSAPVLVVVGTAEPGSRAQVTRLQQAGAVVRALDPFDDEPPAAGVDALDAAVRSGCGVLQVAAGPVRRDRSARVLDRLADTAAAVLARQPRARVVLTGGATARAVLTRLRVDSLHLRCEVYPGAAHLRTDAGRHVVTRPGSHGGPDSLLQLACHLGATLHPTKPDPFRTTAHHSTEGQQ